MIATLRPVLTGGRRGGNGRQQGRQRWRRGSQRRTPTEVRFAGWQVQQIGRSPVLLPIDSRVGVPPIIAAALALLVASSVAVKGGAGAGAAACEAGAASSNTGIRAFGSCSGAGGGASAAAAGATGGRSRGGYVCVDTLNEADANFLPAALSVLGTSIPPSPADDARLRRVRCSVNGVLVSDEFVWFQPGQGLDLDAIASGLARDFAAELLIPRLTMNTDPATAGLVGLDTWFWVDGWDGQPIRRSVTSAGFPFELELDLEAVTWRFGDGTVRTRSGLGAPYPAVDGVIHRFDDRSTSTDEPAGAFQVDAAITLGASYSLRGGPFVQLPPIDHTVAIDLVVREAQAVIR